MYQFPGTYYHPRLHPRDLETKEELLALLKTDVLWQDIPYTLTARRYHRRLWTKQQEEAWAAQRAATRAALLAEARGDPPPAVPPSQGTTPVLAPHIGREWTSFLEEYLSRSSGVRFKEGTRVIETDLRSIVIVPGELFAQIFIPHEDGSFEWKDSVPAVEVLPDGTILLSPSPIPLSPLTGSGLRASPRYTSPPLAAPALEDTEHRALPLSPKKRQRTSKMYADLDILLEDLGYVLDAWRFYRPRKEPTLDELGNVPLPPGVIAAGLALGLPALWPLGMSLSTLKKLLSKKNGHDIDLKAFMRERPRPRRA